MTAIRGFGRPIRWGVSVLALGLALTAGGCGSLLEVENPNNIKGEDIRNPTAAGPLVNGVLSAVARGVNNVNLPIATVTDELDWVGSRDAWRQLEFGDLSDPFNEFTDAAYPELGRARWMADETIQVLEEHRAAGRLVGGNVEPILLVRAHVYAAIAYVTIGDLFDRWAFSDQRTPAPAVAPDEMRQVYDTAIAYLNRAETLALDSITIKSAGPATAEAWRRNAVAMRARAQHARAVWNRIGAVPVGAADTTGGGVVNDAGAVADAQLALSLAGATPDYSLVFTYSATTVGGDFGAWVNNRLEMRLGDVYVIPSATNKTWTDTRIVDPITSARDPVVFATATAFKCGVPGSAGCSASTNYPSFTVVSAREMHLIIAEALLAQGDTIGATSGFATAINALRLLNFPDSAQYMYDPANPAHPRPRAMLIFERQVNLFLQGRRLADMYRFGIRDAKWVLTSEAVTQPGRFLPLTARECLANPLIGSANCRI